MATSATVTIKSDTKDGQKAIQALVKEMERMREENKRLAEENRKAAKEKKDQQKAESDANRKLLSETKEQQKAERQASEEAMRISKEKDAAWRRFGATILTSAGAYVSLNSVLGEANRLLERQAKLQDEIRAKATSIGQAQANTAINFAGLSEGERKMAIGIGGRVNLAQGFGNRAALEAAAGSLISAGATTAQAEKTLNYAANIAPGNSQLVESIGSGIVDLQGSTGMSLEGASGLFLSSAANSRVKDPSQVSKALAKVTSNATSLFDKGGKELAGEEAAALWATTTKMRGDVTGDESATIASDAITKLSSFTGFGDGAPSTLMGRIAMLQNDARLAEEFIKYGGYDKTNPAIGRMLTDREFGYSRMLGQIDQNIGYDPALGGVIQQLHDAQPNIGIVKAQNRLESLSEAGAQANIVEARIAIAEKARQRAHEVLDPISADFTYMGRLGSMERGVTDLVGSEEDRLMIREQNVRALKNTFDLKPLNITDERRDEISDILQELLEATKEQLTETRQMNGKIDRPALNPQGIQEAN